MLYLYNRVHKMSQKTFYTKQGNIIYNPSAYANTGAPMYKSNSYNTPNINEQKYVYRVDCANGKKYIGETKNFDKRIEQHFNGNGAKVTQKFEPKSAKIIDVVPGYYAKNVEQYYTEKYIQKFGYNNVRGGKYTNSLTLK